MAKVCKSCLVEKNEGDFYFRKELNKLNNRCKACCVSNKKHVKDPNNKKCKHCGDVKPNSEYQKAGGGKWLQPYCKDCDSARKKVFYEKEKPRIKIQSRSRYEEWRDRQPPKVKKPRKADDKEYVRSRGLEYAQRPESKLRKSEADRKYRERNREKLLIKKKEYYKTKGLEQKKEWQKRAMSDPEFRITKNLRSRIHVALKRGIKSASTMQLLGCTIEEFIKHFENLFKDGMNWTAYMNGEIHIDHIKPCASFDLTKEEEQRICFHYKNLQPLWELDNLKKGSRYG